jgi:hypothetical protein
MNKERSWVFKKGKDLFLLRLGKGTRVGIKKKKEKVTTCGRTFGSFRYYKLFDLLRRHDDLYTLISHCGQYNFDASRPISTKVMPNFCECLPMFVAVQHYMANGDF